MIDVIDGIFYPYNGYECKYRYSESDELYRAEIYDGNNSICFDAMDLSELYSKFKNIVDRIIV